jgi:L-lactate dehydrogenase complex protein LldF
MVSAAAQEFLRRAIQKSGDAHHQQIIRRATQQSGQRLGKASFQDWEAARQRCYEIKSEALAHLDQYLLEFEQKVQQRGGHVFWAENGEQAREYITGIAKAHAVRVVTKSKSMVAEEIQLAPALEKIGIKVFETDLGEFIVQLRHEPPYHLVTPAMHLTRSDIAALFKEKLEGVDSDDPEKLVAAARRALRKAFFSSQLSITGANFLVADAGMAAITTNEGNAELGIDLAKVHIVLTGIEKIIPRLADLAILWPVLAAAGSGQPITCYNTLVGGPRAPHETDGPVEFHVVLLDNGRTELLADVEQRDVLNCIRCGACLNVCPIFRTVGGHAYGTTYQGPIGSVLTPHLRGLNEFQHLSYASSLCGACTDACPVKIDLHHHLLHNRRNAVNAGDRPWLEKMGFKAWQWSVTTPGRFAFMSRLALSGLRALYALGAEGTVIDPLRPWTRQRAAPDIPKHSFRQLWRKGDGARNGEN